MKAIVFLPLSKDKVATISFEDLEKVRPYKWYAIKHQHNWYARRDWNEGGKKKFIYLHSFLCPCQPGEPNHIDGDGLNNQRDNLRAGTHTQNLQGRRRKKPAATSSFRGVSWYPRLGRWRAQIVLEKKQTHLGYFQDEKAAAQSYDDAAKKFFGIFACPNFL